MARLAQRQACALFAVAALAAGIARGAAALVAVNLTALEGDPRVAEAATLATTAEDAAAHC
jgi:hypothetical protein